MITQYPSITIIIPVKPSGLVKALDSINKLDYPEESLEIIIAEGCRPSSQRNAAAKAAKGDILYFLDDDSMPAVDALKRIAAHFQDGSVTIVGGPSCTPETDTPFQRSAGFTLSSIIGGGGVRNRYRSFGKLRKCRDNELILCNLSIWKNIFLKYGGLDERLYPNEENELIDRLLDDGHTLLHDPELIVKRSQRKNFSGFCRQMYGYGRGRGEQIRISGKFSFFSLMPVFLVIYALILPLLPLMSCIPFIVYLVTVLMSAVYAAISAETAMFTIVMILIPTMHFLYGAGVISGVLSPRFLKEKNSCDIKLTIL